VWKAANEVGYPYGAITKLLLMTGCRLNEVARAQWSEVDLSRRVLTVPPERFKTGAQHVVPLSDDALMILDALPRWARCSYLFTTSGARRRCQPAVQYQRWMCDACGIEGLWSRLNKILRPSGLRWGRTGIIDSTPAPGETVR
jgi:integrase